MAITAVGFDGTITEAEWASFMRHQGTVADKHGVSGSGLVVSAAGGTRTASVSPGTAILPGLRINSDAAVSLTFAANAGSTNRVDAVVVQGNWSTNTATIAVVAGSSTVPPALTQNEGVLWQMPLAYVTVRPGVTTLLSSDIVSTVPYPRRRFSDQARSTGDLNTGLITSADIPGMSLNVPVADTADVFIVNATLYLGMLTSSTASFVGELFIDGVAQTGTVIARFSDTSGRGTFGQQWRITGLAPGIRVFKMRGRLSAASGSYAAFVNSSMTVHQAF